MRIYVATKWERRDRAKGLIQQLIAAGHTITYDWTAQEQDSPRQAVADLHGVATADVVVILAEEDLPYRGTYVELGVALALDIPVWLIGHGLDQCLFVHHPHITRMTWSTMLAWCGCLSPRVE